MCDHTFSYESYGVVLLLADLKVTSTGANWQVCVWSVESLFEVITLSAPTILQTSRSHCRLGGVKLSFEHFKRLRSLCLVCMVSVESLYMLVRCLFAICILEGLFQACNRSVLVCTQSGAD